MSRVKREASSQITKDDVEDGHEGDENIDTGTWTRASDDVIAERRKVKVSRPASSSFPEKEKEDSKNPFSTIALKVSETIGDSGIKSTNPFLNIKLQTSSTSAEEKDESQTKSTEEKVISEKKSPEGSNKFSSLTVDTTVPSFGFGAYANINPFASAAAAAPSAFMGEKRTSSFLDLNPAKSPGKSPGKLNPYGGPSPKGSNPFMRAFDNSSSFWGDLKLKSFDSTNTETNTTSSFFPNNKDLIIKPQKKDEEEDDDNGEDNEKYDPEAEVPITAPPPGTEPVFKGSTDGPLLNGEENEECIIQIRSKLFRLQNNAPKNTTESTDQKDSPDDQNTSSIRQEWADVGVGPLKVLKTKDREIKKNHSRIVMRREAAHNVIMNMTINKFVKLFRQSTNIIRITCVESTQSSDSNKSEFSIASYLLKTQSNQDADKLYKVIENLVDESDTTSAENEESVSK